jgi:hypothetical protein
LRLRWKQKHHYFLGKELNVAGKDNISSAASTTKNTNSSVSNWPFELCLYETAAGRIEDSKNIYFFPDTSELTGLTDGRFDGRHFLLDN